MVTVQEKDVKQKALAYALAIYTLIILVLLLFKWGAPERQSTLIEDGIEVNLGNSDVGLGTEQPRLPGPPSASQETTVDAPKTSTAAPEQMKNIETDESDVNAPEVALPTKANTSSKVSDKPVNTTNTKKPTPIVNPTPTPPKPKAVYQGGSATGAGGNNSDDYHKSNNQGVAGGKGDQGKIDGNADSDSYDGNGGTGKSGVRISKGLSGRKFRSIPSFEDDFNENASVAVDIRVDKAGNVKSATYQPRGSTTGNANLKRIAIEKAQKLKLSADPSGADEQVGTIIFNFRLKS